MALIDLADDPELYAEIHANAKPKDGTEFERRDDPEWLALVVKWSLAKGKLVAYQEIEADLRKELISLAKGKNTCGGGLKAQKIMRKGSIQYQQIPELEGVDLEQYRDMPSESWRITTDE